MRLELPWVEISPTRFYCITLAGRVSVRKTLPPWHLNISVHAHGFSVFIGTRRVTWVQDLRTAFDIAEYETRKLMATRSRTNVLPC